MKSAGWGAESGQKVENAAFCNAEWRHTQVVITVKCWQGNFPPLICKTSTSCSIKVQSTFSMLVQSLICPFFFHPFSSVSSCSLLSIPVSKSTMIMADTGLKRQLILNKDRLLLSFFSSQFSAHPFCSLSIPFLPLFSRTDVVGKKLHLM